MAFLHVRWKGETPSSHNEQEHQEDHENQEHQEDHENQEDQEHHENQENQELEPIKLVEVQSSQLPTATAIVLPNTMTASDVSAKQFSENAKNEISTYAMKPPPLSLSELQYKQRVKQWKREGNEATATVVSALYAVVLVVMGMAFPLSEVISAKIPSAFYEGFYLYLYITAIIFFFYFYITIQKRRTWEFPMSTWRRLTTWMRYSSTTSDSTPQNNNKDSYDLDAEMSLCYSVNSGENTPTTPTVPAHLVRSRQNQASHHGSFYLRMGAVVFGIGGMIYSGLDFGQYFDFSEDSHCANFLVALTPAARMTFFFIQTYFVFLNAKLSKHPHPMIAQFGLMHMTATNLCVWLNIIIQETKHEILHFYHDPSHSSHGSGHHVATGGTGIVAENATNFLHDRHKRGASLLQDECRRTDLMGRLVQDASPFLFPCAIEYSLICAAVMYEMWKHSRHSHAHNENGQHTNQGHRRRTFSSRQSPHHYSVDCTNANKGLFFGIFVLVGAIISMILFIVLLNRSEYKAMAITEVHLVELVLYAMTFGAVLIGLFQMREMKFDAWRSMDLDNGLLLVAQTGVITYNAFTIIAAHFAPQQNMDTILVLITALAALLQALTQSLFILDASKRVAFSALHQHKKPGREIVTFLLVTNFAMWAVTTLEKSRADAHPVQMTFYGPWPWTIITNVSMPLAIFYRYHSTVCLCEIWKRCYKVKQELV